MTIEELIQAHKDCTKWALICKDQGDMEGFNYWLDHMTQHAKNIRRKMREKINTF